jgi:spermidine synthase
VVLAGTCIALFPFGLMERSFFKIVQVALPNHTLVETREGLMETMRYYRSDVFGAPHFYRLVTNGYSMSATTVIAKRYMKLYVYLPLALQHDARDALLISFGVGSTAKALTDSTGLRHIDVVDISREILELSSVVYTDTENPLHDKRVTVHVEDGRFFLNTHGHKYDLITSEPPPPKVAGVVNLYSQEYFQSIREHLTPGGYTTYWLPVHQLQPLDTLAIIKGFCGALDDCSLWSGAGLEWMLMGSNGATGGVSAETFSAQWRDERVRRELVALGFEMPEQMGSLFMSDAPGLAALTAGVAPVTDNYPLRISDSLVRVPGRVPLYDTVMDERRRLERFEQSAFIERLWPRDLREDSAPFFRYEGMIKDHFTNGLYPNTSEPFLWERIDDVLANTSLETLPLWLLGTDRDTERIATDLAADSTASNDVEIEIELALDLLARRDYASALRHMDRYLAGGGDMSVGRLSLLLYLLGKNEKFEEANGLIDSVDVATTPEIGAFLKWFERKFPRDKTG